LRFVCFALYCARLPLQVFEYTLAHYLPLVLLEAVNEENHSPERDGACGREGGWPSDAHE